MELQQSPFQLKHPTTCLIAGPTGCGKTRFVARLLQSVGMITPTPGRIVWVYGEWQPTYDSLKATLSIEFRKNCLDAELYESFSPAENNVLILDDQMSSASISQRRSMLQLFTQGSHHRNLTIIYIVQNLFDQGSTSRTISLNSQYMVLFKNPRDSAQIRYLAAQVYPKNHIFLVDSYSDATRASHSYLVLNLTQDCEEWLRVSTLIFPGEDSEIYVPNDIQLPDELLYKSPQQSC